MTRLGLLVAMALVAGCSEGGTALEPAPDAGAGAEASADASTEAGAGGDGAVNPTDGSAADGGGGSDGASPTCDPSSVAGIMVATVTGGSNPLDPLGYPPYALDRCTLAYVAPATVGQTSGELHLRNLVTGGDALLAASSEQPRRPSIAGDLVAWEAVAAGKSTVRVSKGGQTTNITGPFDHTGEPRVTSDAVVFTAWLTGDDAGDTDVYIYLPMSSQLVAVATGPGQQRFADVSSTLVAVTDFSEDPTGAFSTAALRLADIVVFDRQTLVRTVRHLPGRQAFPMLGSTDHLAYLDWGFVNPEPKFSAYGVDVGTVSSNPATDGNVKGSGQVEVNTPYVRPSVSGDWIEWVDDSTSPGGLFGCPLDLSQTAHSTLGGAQLLGPVAGQSLTVVATPSAGGIALQAITR